MKKIITLILAGVVAVGLMACGGATGGSDKAPAADGSAPAEAAPAEANADRVGGKILFMSNLNSGAQYDAYLAYLDMALGEMGYDYEVVIGDPANDPAGNLSAVQNSMTNDVVGLIMSQDGGVAEIMAEFPDLYVAGFMCDMASVFSPDGTSAACLENDHFLGTIGDMYINGEDMGKMYFDLVVEKGYKKVSTITFPPFAYPSLMVADATFRGLVEEYNATADEPIEVVGDAEVLMFEPLGDSYFMEPTHQDLDAIVAPIAGCSFVYPTMKSAMDAGTISADTKLLTSGFENDDTLLADFGGEGTIQSITIGGVESIVWPVVMLDNAIQGNMPADYAGPEQVDSAIFMIASAEDMDAVMSSSLLGTGDSACAVADWTVIQSMLTTYNADATYAALNDYVHSDALTVSGLK